MVTIKLPDTREYKIYIKEIETLIRIPSKKEYVIHIRPEQD